MMSNWLADIASPYIFTKIRGGGLLKESEKLQLGEQYSGPLCEVEEKAVLYF